MTGGTEEPAADPPPPPAAWEGTPAEWHTAMNNAGFTWNPQHHWWAWHPPQAPGPGPRAQEPQPEP